MTPIWQGDLDDRGLIRQDRALRDLADRTQDVAPVECPNDGTPLQVNGNGVRNCPMGDFRWNG